ncbi:hypothetical protein KKH27_06290 [bacterium]|nr:hypothetical protein [bacterium]MBU1984216.1 hypothetical protein [bacterium]
MSSKPTFGWVILVCLGLLLLPRIAICADWGFSPYRTQIAEGQLEETAEPSVMTEPGLQKKNIGKAVMFSLVIPGAGQLYAGSWKTAIPWFALEVAGWAMFASYQGQGRDKTDEFEAYAGSRDAPNNFNYRAYMWQEYALAKDTVRNGGRPRFTGSFDDWINPSIMSWDGDPDPLKNRYTYLPAPFTHDVMTNDEQQYFEMIGKYILQFGFGWLDTYNYGNGWNSGLESTDPPDRTPWDHPAGDLRADDPSNRQFDGESLLFYVYRDMRGEANDFLDKANVAMEVVLVNHVLSSLHAAFLVRNQNHRIDRASNPLGDLRLQYDAKPLDGSMTRSLTLSYPIR